MVKGRRITWRPGLEHDGLVFEPGKAGRKRNKWNLRSDLRQQSAVINGMGLHDRRVAINTAGAIGGVAIALGCIVVRVLRCRCLPVTGRGFSLNFRDCLISMTRQTTRHDRPGREKSDRDQDQKACYLSHQMFIIL